jgi:radical SAM superfamily enzyme YgiQ (UPF0313 family)
MKVSEVCFTALNSKFIHSSLSALNLSKMCEVYSEKFSLPRININVNERTINESFDSVMYSVLKSKADVYAFSVYIWNVQTVLKVCRQLKKAFPDSVIVLGGPEISYDIEHTGFNDGDYDYVICSEGERAFFALLCELNGFGIPPEWNYVTDGKKRSCDYIEDLSEIVFPYNKENIGEFSDRIIYYEASRGCPFSCAYCLSSVCGKVRTLSFQRVKSDIDFFMDENVSQVKFVDRTFNCNKKRAVEIWKYIIENADKCNTNFHFEIGADLLDDEELSLLSKARPGLIQLELGIQSTNIESLDECCRKTDMKKLFGNVERLVSFKNINIHVDLIVGLPYEDLERFKTSFNDTYYLRANQLQLGFLKLLSGAPLNGILKKHGYVFSDYPPYEIIENNYITYHQINELKKFEDVFERYYNSGRFKTTLEKAEKYFRNPFEMFEKLTEFFEKKSLTFKPVSTKILYDNLKEFLLNTGENFDKELLTDFYQSERSDIVPSSLKYLALNIEKSGELLKNSSQRKNKKAQVKFVGNDAYIIDYSSRNPVDGLYTVAEVIKNVCL